MWVYIWDKPGQAPPHSEWTNQFLSASLPPSFRLQTNKKYFLKKFSNTIFFLIINTIRKNFFVPLFSFSSKWYVESFSLVSEVVKYNSYKGVVFCGIINFKVKAMIHFFKKKTFLHGDLIKLLANFSYFLLPRNVAPFCSCCDIY